MCPLLLLPGLHGTSSLFQPFLHELPEPTKTYAASFPVDLPLSYEDLLPIVEQVVPQGTHHAVLGESFSGPLAIRYARERPEDVRALVLCGSFVKCPFPRSLAFLSWLVNPLAFLVRSSRFLIRASMLSADSPRSLVDDVRSAISQVAPAVLSRRVQSILGVDVVHELRELSIPVLYLAGAGDRMVGRKSVDLILQTRPSTLVRTLDAPHLILQARPREAAKVVLEFVASIKS